MKRNIALCLINLFLLSAFLRADDSAGSLYEFTAEDGAEDSIPSIERELESRFSIYNRLFRFDPELLSSPLKVRVFAGKEAYDKYIAERLGFTVQDAVYLHYGRRERRELVICHDGVSAETGMLSHQAFIQFLRGFIPAPPDWMLEGFGIYYSPLRYNYSGIAEYEENLLWLETVKNQMASLPSPAAIIGNEMADVPAKTREDNMAAPSLDFRVSSWALVSFLLNGGRDYYRALTDSFLVLSPLADTTENTVSVLQRISLQNNMEAMDRDFRNYLNSRKTFSELMEEGQRSYSLRDYMNAELSFLTAKEQRPSDYSPYYFLGLLSYDGKNFPLAERYYLDSMERGADAALVNFALGNNAAAAGRYTEAAGFLQKAAALDPARYRARSGNLLLRMGQQGLPNF